MSDDDRLDRAVLDTYEVPEPSTDLGDRFLARLAAPAPRRGRTQWIAAAGTLVAVAAVIALVAFRTTPEDQSASGARRATARTTEALGRRGVAVLEAGGALAWEIAGDGTAALHQDRGDVFYRVEPGGPFVVTTPAAEVSVHGTCFRVELEPSGVVVTVYEGKVALANARGRIELLAGEHGIATTDAAPRALAVPTLATVPQPSVAELLARDRAQRDRIAELEARLARTGPEAIGAVQDGKRPFEMTQAELAELATTCKVPLDVPPSAGSTLMDQIIAEGARKAGLTDADRAAVARVVEAFQPAYQNELEQLYREITGEQTAPLDPLTLILEITQKTPAAELPVAYQRVSAERAGLRAAPTAGNAPVIDRYLRFAIAASDNFERQLAAEIGADRAHAFRRTWAMVNLDPGCPPH
jgi:FecR-like protein